MMGRKFLERFRRSSPPPQRAASKVDAQKSKTQIPQNGRLDRRRKTPTVDDESGKRGKLDQTTREIVRGVERPKLAVYPFKCKRYFHIVQQEPRKLLPFRAFFYIFARAADFPSYPSCAIYHFFPVASSQFFSRFRALLPPTLAAPPLRPRDSPPAAMLVWTNNPLF